ncbi:TadE/TadG family type IV pilus assembly protein [Novosphingobium sp. TH158]|uniref:TadE/TadG family type IV pilus assembly protein n=1 Tax=Novosphingobium sp. TH158 TaxID=2067455 RepID=UPI001303F5CA|nr:TadE/TadG family type IV pilus assembly protein [Novosphingobium sp. TH158]
MMTMRNLMRHLWHDQRGVSAVEAAIFMPILLSLAVGAIDLTQLSVMRLNLQQVANAGAAMAVAGGNTPPDNTTLAARLAADTGMAASAITVTRWTECNEAAQANIAACPNASDVRADYLTVTVTGSYTPIFSGPFGKLAQTTTYVASSTARIR